MDYFGMNLDRRVLEVQGLRIDPIHRADEPGLMQTRWFDYEGLHPVAATYLFAAHYKAASRTWYETMCDIETAASESRAFTPDDIFMSRDLTSMWMARQCADKLGVPYEYALTFARERALSQSFKHMPRPNQLYYEEFELDLKDDWDATFARSLRYSRLAMYRVENWKGTPAQQRHLGYVVGQIQRRQRPHHHLLSRMFKEGVLSPLHVREHFDQSEIDAASRDAGLGGKSVLTESL